MEKQMKIIAVFVMLSLLLAGCQLYQSLGIDDAELLFDECYDDILTVSEFLISSEYELISIRDEGYPFSISVEGTNDIKYDEIEISTPVESAIKRLMRETLECTVIFKNGNTIEFVINSGVDVSCGIAYTISGVDLPEIGYLSKLLPMEADGWYYYETNT